MNGNIGVLKTVFINFLHILNKIYSILLSGAPPTAREVEADLKSLLLSGNHKGAIDPKSITPLSKLKTLI